MAEELDGWELEGWRAGGLEGWRAGGLEGWRAARLRAASAKQLVSAQGLLRPVFGGKVFDPMQTHRS